MRIVISTLQLLSISACFAISACSGSVQTYHCDLRSGSEPEDRCQERSVDALVGATSSVQYQELCSSDILGGTAGDGPCPRENAIAT